ncbi:MAG: hypothetical protein PHO63_00820 [Bacilli bacterium]|nr:hypothetical protein [Bacilli bacterium]MDD4809352.1 hypothetical protein [Bacilli bacterium]
MWEVEIISNKVLKYSPNYNDIVNYNFDEDDFVSQRIINYYQEYLFGNIYKPQLKKIKVFDKIVWEYIKNDQFYQYVQYYLKELELSNSDLDYYEHLDRNLEKLYKDFDKNSLKKVVSTKWL